MFDIIIPHYGKQELLDCCLASIEANTLVKYKVAVIDNNKKNRGFAAAINEGIRRSSGEYVVLLNNDTVVPSGWLRSMWNVIQGDRSIAAVGPLSTARAQWQSVDKMEKRLKMELPVGAYITSSVVPFTLRLAFWCVLIPKRALDDVGLLDERFFMYGEDDDWCLRAEKKRYKLALDLNTVVQHDHRTHYTEETQRHHEKSRQKFITKWGFLRS